MSKTGGTDLIEKLQLFTYCYFANNFVVQYYNMLICTGSALFRNALVLQLINH